MFGHWRREIAWKRRIGAISQPGNAPAVLRRASAGLTAILCDNLLPFWVEHVPGGAGADGVFLAEQRAGGRFLSLILATRYLWFLGRLIESPWRQDLHADLARTAYGWLREHLYDTSHGGFFWEADLDSGAPSKPRKQTYGQAFAIYALAQYGKATGDASAVDLAVETAGLLEAHAHDADFGGHFECFEPDWRRSEGLTYLGWDARCKLVNTTIHVLEGFTALFEASPQALVRDRILEQARILTDSTIVGRLGVSLDAHERDWTPVPEPRNRVVSYGHNLETLHLVATAHETLGLDRGLLLAHFRRSFASCTRWGFDFERGGYFESGPLSRPAAGMAKIWWVQAEAMLAALAMYELTREEAYLAVFEAVLRWIATSQVDWDGGEWHERIDLGGRASGAKMGRWKGPYHSGRAVLAGNAMIERLLPPGPPAV